MKKFLILFFVLVLILSLCACSFSFKTDNDLEVGIDLGNVNQDETIDVTINIPASIADKNLTQADYDKMVVEKGYKSVTLNDDGSVTYVMSAFQHDKMMKEIDASLEKLLNETVKSADNKITAINHNENYTSFTVNVDSESLGLADSINSLAFMLYGGMYSAFNGTEVENIHIKYISNITGEVLSETNSADFAE